MRRFFIRRVFTSITTIFVVLLVVFFLSRLHSDPRMLYIEEDLPMEAYEAMGRQLGLDKPIPYQFVIFVAHLARGDLGKSIHQRRAVSTIVIEKVPASAKLALGGFLFALLVGLPLGVVSAVKRGTLWDYASRTFAVLGHSMPSFWVAIMSVLIFSVGLNLLPTSRAGGIDHFILPSIALGYASAGGMLRLVRSSMLEVLDSEYVKLARAKGVNRQQVIWKHALRNALLAPLTYAGLLVGGLITGSVITETVFAWPGLGLLAINAMNSADYAILQGVVLLFGVFYILTTLIVDMLYAFIDPRIRYN